MTPPHDGDPATTSERTSSESATHDPSYGFDHLMGLFQEVISARAAMTVARRAPLGRSRLIDAPRARLLLALEAYTAELNVRNLPVPYAIRDDLRIQRRILGRVSDATS
jgi:hypothetical protein